MLAFETILVMLGSSVVLLAIAGRLGIPYPVLLALVGAVVAVTPLPIALALEPDLILALFIAPVLLDAAFDTSFRDLKRYWQPIMSLVVVAVGLTTAAVAVVARWLVPDLPWGAAIALGAIVAPPDAVATTTVLRSLKLPLRVSTILEGEALLNDASALLIYRLALIAVAAGGSLSVGEVAPTFVLSVFGSVVVGLLLARLANMTTGRVTDRSAAIIAQFVSTWGVWLVAERLGLSPILTIVTYAIALSRTAPLRHPAEMRLPTNAVWDTAVLVLNVLAFLLIGLQLRVALDGAPPGALPGWLLVGVAVLVTVIVVRMFWSVLAAIWRQAQVQAMKAPAGIETTVPTWRTGIVIGWAGTRGLVTVATALALPEDFPQRPLLLLVAFMVTLGTLLIQGLTLGPLVRILQIPPDDVVDGEVRLGRVESARAALAALEGATGTEADILRAELEGECATDSGRADSPELADDRAELVQRVLHARRKRLVALRDDGTIGDEAFHTLEGEIDASELAIVTRRQG